MMVLFRKFEIACDNAYKERKIRGFLHLYNGQEAICSGMESAITKEDMVITAYRDHAHQMARGDTPESTMAELFGKGSGCSKGKGGSMHMYSRKNNFFGGNGIVGAQVAVGTGLGFALKYQKKKNVAIALYGDGASNQGQVFESYNMASLWGLPMIYVCEDNKYGMGTSVGRSSASTDYYSRGDYVPGIKVDGNDIFSVMEATRYAKEWAIENGPIILHMETYRYYGHSMSDPGISYRTREEVSKMRKERDPILIMGSKLAQKNILSETEQEDIDKFYKNQMVQVIEKATEEQLTPESEFHTDVYADNEYSIRGVNYEQIYHYKK
jgi:pyruvate dehydrogenase E1 component alpha subunit